MKQIITTLLLCLLSITALAQVTGVATLQGAVNDNAGAVVANAEVTVKNLDTGVAVKAMTNDAGLYRVAGLNPGQSHGLCRRARERDAAGSRTNGAA